MDQSQPSQAPHGAYRWFTESQLRSVICNGIIPEWFHGTISRKMAEELLMSKPPGYFLIRVSESRIGYTLSYRAEDCCRHFMIDELEDGHYIIVGDDRCHRFLQDLVDFHRHYPIIPFKEVLTVACGKNTDYAELLFPQRPPRNNMHVQPNSLLLPNASSPVLQEQIPPALPFRANIPRNTGVLSPKSQSNQHYPTLEDQAHVADSLPATPVPMPRKRYNADNLLSTRPPEVPLRISVPPLKQNQACVRTSATEHLACSNAASVKNQDSGLSSVLTNQKILNKKVQNKTSGMQEIINTEINTENEYEEITEERTICSPHYPYTDVTNRGTPQEYLPPPPFAPGY